MAQTIIEVKNLAIGYGAEPLLQNLNFAVQRGEIFGILGDSGCGKSTLLKHLIGLYRPLRGTIHLFNKKMDARKDKVRRELQKNFGVAYQSGALLGSMTVAENVALPLEENTDLSWPSIALKVREKLELVDMQNAARLKPAELSGGMIKRVAIARALAADPELVFLDEPTAGLDPISAGGVDELILKLSRELGVTVVVVTHDLETVFSVVDRLLLLQRESHSMVALGRPRELACGEGEAWVHKFLNRGNFFGKDTICK